MSLAEHYDQGFYDSQMADSLEGARIYLRHLWTLSQPSAVLDVGCGRGMWLKACAELGATRLLGLDGSWNRQELMADPHISFRAIDLNQRFVVEKVDLAMSLEVAEHLEPASAAGFVASLAAAADTVLFGAAYDGQGGTNHINEQPASYWAALFNEQGFDPYDVFRPALWGDERVPFWYRQNTFLYARRGTSQSFGPPVGRAFMDCVHPVLFENTRRSRDQLREAEVPFSEHVRSLAPSLVRAVRRRVGG